MTIDMPDSVVPANMPQGYEAYLAYVDGERSKDADQVRAMFPGAKILTLTVLGGTAVADGCDREPGDLPAAAAAAWAAWRLSQGAWRPVIYASVSNMAGVLSELALAGVTRDRVRLLSAHYGSLLGKHVCGPRTCGLLTVDADGTQWTSSFPGLNGSVIDMSLLRDGFFGTPAPVKTWEDTLMASIPVISKGSKNVKAVRNWQGLLVAHGWNLGGSGPQGDGIDGVFGGITDTATREFQRAAEITVDGKVGPVTWGAALRVG